MCWTCYRVIGRFLILFMSFARAATAGFLTEIMVSSLTIKILIFVAIVSCATM